MPLSEASLLELAASDPDWLLEQLDKVDGEESLKRFGELIAWPVLEPGRKFIDGWIIDCLCDHLYAVSLGQIRILNVNVPPGIGKSVWVDAIWPAFEWGPHWRPDLRYVSASYSHDLTIRNNRRCKAIISSARYQKLWGSRFKLNPEQNAKTRFDNDHMGFKIATSTGGLGVGERGDRFIIDDGNNIKDVESDAIRAATNLWLTEIVPTRVNDPEKSVFVNIQQRTHTNDCTGTIQENWGPDVVNVIVPMEFERERKCFVEVTGWSDPREEDNELLWPERYSRPVVEKLKTTLGTYATAGQLQQRPSPRGGGMFKRTWWNFYETGHPVRPPDVTDRPAIPLPSRFDWCLVTVDAAFKATTTGSRVGMLVIGGRGTQRFVLGYRTRPMTFTQTCANILELNKTFNGSTPRLPRVMKTLIEDKANGPAIIDSLMTKVSGIIAVNPEGGKEARANVLEAPVEAGQWYVPEGEAWVAEFIGEFAAFPTGQFDDNVDAASQCETYIMTGADVARIANLGKL